MIEPRPPEILSASHDTSAFDCGKAPLNQWLQEHAFSRQNAMLSRTYVAMFQNRIAGYYTLTHSVAVQTELPKKLGRGMPSLIPAMLMARFAIDLEFQGQGLGRSLFINALERTWAVMSAGAAPVRFFVVDAKDEQAKAFYERFDMTPSPVEPLRLYLSYKTLRAEFSADA